MIDTLKKLNSMYYTLNSKSFLTENDFLQCVRMFIFLHGLLHPQKTSSMKKQHSYLHRQIVRIPKITSGYP